MKASGENDRERRFSDVRARQERGVKRLFSWAKNRGKTIDLKPAFYRRYRVSTALVALLIGALAFWGIGRLFTRAEVADFYPSTCLGAWANAQNAQGKPEMLTPVSTSTTFDENNSAVFISGTGQIFCGGFMPPDYATTGDVKSVGLTFVWQVGEPTTTSSFPQGAQISTSTADSSTTPPTDKTSMITPPENQSTTSLLHSKFYILNPLFFNLAFAQTDSTGSPQAASGTTPSASDGTTTMNETPTAPTPIPEPTNKTTTPIGAAEQAASDTQQATTETSTTIIGPPLQATLAPIVSSTEQATSTVETSETVPITAPVIAPPQLDNNFLQISYSTDGEIWIAIAKVNGNNWQNFTVTLPISSWDLLRKLQIQIAGIPTTQNPTPKVYLDGMFAEVHYDLPPAFAGVLGGGSPEGAAPQPANSPIGVPAGTPVIVLPPSQKPTTAKPGQNTFKADEAPQFNLDLNSLVAPSSTPAP